MPILFLKMGWMIRYQGTKGDDIFSSMSYVQEFGRGHERLNFKSKHGKCYGYAPVSGIDIQKNFGALPGAKYVDGIDVVWASNRPKPLGGLVIVGWYRNARVYRCQRPAPSLIIAEANAADCTLLPVDDRLYELPLEGPGAFRTAKNWYGREHPKILKDVQKMLDGTYKPKAGKFSPGKTTDPDSTHRAEIEKIAIDFVTREYTNRGYDVLSFEKENRGWDLEATKGMLCLKLEVKGTSHSAISPLLTPNEYRASNKERAAYRLCVVSNALAEPSLCDLRYIDSLGAWIDESGEQVWDITAVESGQATRRK